MEEIKWNNTKEDTMTIVQIAKRAVKLINGADFMSLQMDISAVHLNDVKLDLSRLLNADDSNFLHDICGINYHLDRDTGKLQNCFLPRFTLKG